MSGKASPSLRRKTLYNVERSNLSTTDKNCIREVFDRYYVALGTIYDLRAELETAKTEARKELAKELIDRYNAESQKEVKSKND